MGRRALSHCAVSTKRHQLRRAERLSGRPAAAGHGLLPRGDAREALGGTAVLPRSVLDPRSAQRAAAWCAVSEGQPAETWLIAAELGAYDAVVPGEPDTIASATSLLRAAVAHHGVIQMGADARFSSRLQPPGDPWWGITHYLEAVA